MQDLEADFFMSVGTSLKYWALTPGHQGFLWVKQADITEA